MRWSAEQDAALGQINRWLRSSPEQQWLYLGGYAGTGKTTLAKHIAEGVDGPVCFAAYTGKAASVMRAKGCDGARTLHSLLYTARTDDLGNVTFELDEDSPAVTASLVILDEVSMVDEALAKDLLWLAKRVLVTGDPEQLPPVSGSGFFTVNAPDVMLTEIHRQAAESPIIRLSMDVREGRGIAVGDHGAARVVTKRGMDPALASEADQVLVGMNATRNKANAWLRSKRGIEGAPQRKDRLVCLRNNRKLGIYNGAVYDVLGPGKLRKKQRRKPDEITLNVRGEGEYEPVTVRAHQGVFGGGEVPRGKEGRGYDPFDYGYALTVHKSQGSQWDKVCIFDESRVFREDAKRHLYTGITRAAEDLTVVLNAA
ncbi:MAG: AAA family ATPase [Pseudomonadota bacterium]